MQFNNRQDNEILIDRLEKIICKDTISHAYIFEGDNSIDKLAFVYGFVKGILCPINLGENCGKCSICRKLEHDNYEDLIYISGREQSIKDADIINMQQRIKTKPFGSRNIVIIDGSDTMTTRAQNRLLKTLEEPPGNTVIILISENIENLIQTIQSRCVKYRINYFGSDGYDFMMNEAREIIDMTINKEPFYRLKGKVEELAKDKGDTAALLDSMEIVYRNMVIDNNKAGTGYRDEDIIERIHFIEKGRKQVQQGVSAAYVLKDLVIKIGG